MVARQLRSGAINSQVAAIAARLLCDGDDPDFAAARQRAHLELGLQAGVSSADNLAIHRAMVEYLGLFHHQAQAQLIDRMRRAALQAMTLLSAFSPRLCGPVWYGTAAAGSTVNLHLCSDEVEAVTRFLLERRIEYRLDEQPFRFSGAKVSRTMPVFDVTLGGEWFELAVFPSSGQYRLPISALDRRPMSGASAAELAATLDNNILFPDLHAANR